MKVRCQCLMGLDKALKILLNYIFIGISTKNAYLKVKKNTFQSIFFNLQCESHCDYSRINLLRSELQIKTHLTFKKGKIIQMENRNQIIKKENNQFQLITEFEVE